MNRLDHLPSELISLFLSHVDEKKDLYTCTLINKSFYKCATPLLWEHLEIDNDDTLGTITAALESSGHVLGGFVRSVSIENKLSDNDLLAFIKHVPLLNDLSLESACDITDASFERVPLHVPHLTQLCIAHSDMTQWSMEAMRRHWYRQLNHLEFQFCFGLNYELFSALRQCTALTSLAISHCCLDDNNVLDTIQDAAWNAMALTNLTSLRIQDNFSNYTAFIAVTTTTGQQQQLDLTLLFQDVDDNDPPPPHMDQMQLQLPVWPHLTELVLGACHDMTDTMAIAFIQSHLHLLRLELSGSERMTDKTLDAIATYLPKIVDVNVDNDRGITADGLRQMMKKCAKLVAVGCDGGHLYPIDFPDVDPSSMEIDYFLNGISYVTLLYGGAFDT